MTPSGFTEPPTDDEIAEYLESIRSARNTDDWRRAPGRSRPTWRGGTPLDALTEWQYQQERHA
ncbi:hypothetical protein [Streptosporangium saharense]|uniref:Uncharacterized protein n=1 Tax=Streptosporangium saharense TaxID=1706840 RepID=A0A7W7QK95_9ACTN|nr:hypothetical protein [Streptosporangium saharense]MBB4915063.1 hypothetical protein [Streptosporangium saharense]